MWGIKNIRIVDFMCENGIYPEYESMGVSFFKTSNSFRTLLDRYFIINTCIPNKVGSC